MGYMLWSEIKNHGHHGKNKGHGGHPLGNIVVIGLGTDATGGLLSVGEHMYAPLVPIGA